MIIQVLVGLLLILNPSFIDYDTSLSPVVAAGESFNESVTNPPIVSQLIPGNDNYIELNNKTHLDTFQYVFTNYPMWEYRNDPSDKNCEKLSKFAQEKYGGSLIFLVGIDAEGNYIKGDYAGHFLNKIYDSSKKQYWYVDYQTQIASEDLEDHINAYIKYNGYPDAESFDLEEGRPPFSMIWHY